MKTKSLLNTLFLIILMGIAGIIHAQDFTVGDLNYSVNDDGVSVTVTGHVFEQWTTGELNIPESVAYEGNSYSVTIIGEWAFGNCQFLSGPLIIPNSVISIGNGAFVYCESFTSLTIPNSVTEIGYNAFAECRNLAGSLIIPSSVTSIGEFAFTDCSGFTGSLIIPNSVVHIGSNPFSGCSGLQTISVDSGNSHYDSRNNCNAIIETSTNALISGCENTIIPNSVTSIKEWAYSFSYINSLYLPSSVISIEPYAFYGCSNLYEILVDSANPVFDSRNNCNAIIRTTDNELIVGCTNTIIPNNITLIGNNAFAYCYFNEPITIPQSVLTIGSWAFENCSFNGSLIIPNSVINIGIGAFSFCDIQGSLTIGNSTTNINDYAFQGCSSNGLLIIPSSITYIGNYAFAWCEGFTEAISLALTPPELGGNELGCSVFYEFCCNTLTVPCGCVSAYTNTNWYAPNNYYSSFTTIIEDCSSVAEFDENTVSVFPNPTYGSINIESENIQSVSIYNMLGEKVFENTVNGSSFNYNFSENAEGVYIIRIETPEGVATKKVMVK